jgi:hypothetical protein
MTVTIGRRELLGFFCLNRCNERAASNAAHVLTGEGNQARRRGLDSPRYEAEVAGPLGMTLQILFGVVGMSMWLTP